MKLASVQTQGRACFGAVMDGGFIDLSARFAGRCNSLADLLRQDLVHDTSRLCIHASPDIPFPDMVYLPLISDRDAA